MASSKSSKNISNRNWSEIFNAPKYSVHSMTNDEHVELIKDDSFTRFSKNKKYKEMYLDNDIDGEFSYREIAPDKFVIKIFRTLKSKIQKMNFFVKK